MKKESIGLSLVGGLTFAALFFPCDDDEDEVSFRFIPDEVEVNDELPDDAFPLIADEKEEEAGGVCAMGAESLGSPRSAPASSAPSSCAPAAAYAIFIFVIFSLLTTSWSTMGAG